MHLLQHYDCCIIPSSDILLAKSPDTSGDSNVVPKQTIGMLDVIGYYHVINANPALFASFLRYCIFLLHHT